MARRFDGPEIVVATHNDGKLREIRALLDPLGIAVSSAGEHRLPEPEETGTSFVGNAALKALAAATAVDLPALGDDSGLVVRGLDGAPGLFSARWAGPNKDFSGAMERVRRELADRGSTDTHAAFVCALTLAWPDGHVESFEGRIEGSLVFPPRGELGFGYDPIFVPDGDTRTFGEIPADEKHRTSHRARAFAQLLDACFGP